LWNVIENGGTGRGVLVSEKGEIATKNAAARETGGGKTEDIAIDRGDGK
jgi:hypothetical protein